MARDRRYGRRPPGDHERLPDREPGERQRQGRTLRPEVGPGNSGLVVRGTQHRASAPALPRAVAIVGNLIPAALVDAWFDARGMDRLGETGSASYNTTAGAQRANDTTSPFLPVRPVATARPSIDFGGNWTRIARLVWAGNAVVDGANS